MHLSPKTTEAFFPSQDDHLIKEGTAGKCLCLETFGHRANTGQVVTLLGQGTPLERTPGFRDTQPTCGVSAGGGDPNSGVSYLCVEKGSGGIQGGNNPFCFLSFKGGFTATLKNNNGRSSKMFFPMTFRLCNFWDYQWLRFRKIYSTPSPKIIFLGHPNARNCFGVLRSKKILECVVSRAPRSYFSHVFVCV